MEETGPTPARDPLHDAHTLERIEAVLDRLDRLLERERLAVADFDPLGLIRLRQLVQAAVDELASLSFPEATSDPARELTDLRARIAERMRDVRASAAVNDTMLRETALAVAEALGLA